MNDEPRPDIDTWAEAHGFTPSSDQIGGTTQLLDLGMLDTTDAAYRGEVDGHEAVLAEFSVGSPDWSEAFGGWGVDSTGFTVFLLFVDASRWPRLTVHPSAFSEHDWARRCSAPTGVCTPRRRGWTSATASSRRATSPTSSSRPCS